MADNILTTAYFINRDNPLPNQEQLCSFDILFFLNVTKPGYTHIWDWGSIYVIELKKEKNTYIDTSSLYSVLFFHDKFANTGTSCIN